MTGQSENVELASIVGGIFLVALGTGMLVQLLWAIIERNTFQPGAVFFFGFASGGLIAWGLAFTLWGTVRKTRSQ